MWFTSKKHSLFEWIYSGHSFHSLVGELKEVNNEGIKTRSNGGNDCHLKAVIFLMGLTYAQTHEKQSFEDLLVN